MSVSNKTLSILLLAAIVVSLGGTFISLNRLGSLGTTGYTSYDDAGTIVLQVDDNLQITLLDEDIVFGTCTLIDGSEGFTVNTDNSGSHNNGLCTGSFQGGIKVLNVGNIIANVQLYVNDTASDQGGNFMNISTSGADSSFEYKTVDSPINNGCVGDKEDDYGPFIGTGVENLHTGCSILNTGTNNRFVAHFQIGIPDNARGQSSVEITFHATEA